MRDQQHPKLRHIRLQDFRASHNYIATLDTQKIVRATPLPEISLEQARTQRLTVVSGKQRKIKTKKRVSLIVRIVSTVLLFAFLLRSFSWSGLLEAFRHVDVGGMLVGLIVGAFCIVLSAYQWRSLLHAEKIRFDLADLIDLYMVGIAFSHFLPTGMGGDAVKALYVGRASGNNAGATSAVLMSRITGFFAMLLIAFPVMLICHDHFSQTVMLWFVLLSFAVGAMIVGAICLTTLLPKLYRGRFVAHRIFISALRVGNALWLAVRRPQVLGIGLIIGVIFWTVSCLNYYSYASALNMHVPLYFYFVAIPLISLMTFLPISLNGFGVRESAFVYIFVTMHVAPATALLLALVTDVQVVLFGIIGGCLYLLIGNKKKLYQTANVVVPHSRKAAG
jgi:uncharacterized protein (TIRG00374 family)